MASASPPNRRPPPGKPAPGKSSGPGAAAAAPLVLGFRLAARRVQSADQLVAALASLSFAEIVPEADCITLLHVESRDIQKNPYLFSVIRFRPADIEVIYTVVPGMSPKKRRLDMLRYLLNVLTHAGPAYAVDNRQVFQLLEAALTDMTEYVSLDYDKLYSSYDSLKDEVESLQKRERRLADSNDALARENAELKAKLGEVQVKLNEALGLSDDVLAAKVQEWLTEHNGEINLSEFSRVYHVPEGRVEQALNRLVTEGYLESRQ